MDSTRGSHDALTVSAASRTTRLRAVQAESAMQAETLCSVIGGLEAQTSTGALIGASLLVASIAVIAWLADAFASLAGTMHAALLR